MTCADEIIGKHKGDNACSEPRSSRGSLKYVGAGPAAHRREEAAAGGLRGRADQVTLAFGQPGHPVVPHSQEPSCRCAAFSRSASGGVSGLRKYPSPRCFGSATTVWMWPLEHRTNSACPETSWWIGSRCARVGPPGRHVRIASDARQVDRRTQDGRPDAPAGSLAMLFSSWWWKADAAGVVSAFQARMSKAGGSWPSR